ncbi:hypothetical protein NYE33_22265 [Paenibacillus sp. FSL R10-2199]|uniref:hypothetical protein n=1 Tax=Paenibacillus sp. FSL R10-2199 TaxID=2975348 RepID=UPI0030F4D4C4
MRKIYREMMDGCEWIVDADLRDFFGTVHHEPLVDRIAEQVTMVEFSNWSDKCSKPGAWKVGRNTRQRAARRKVA